MWNYGSLPGDWTVKKIGEYASIITDYVANGSFASLAQNVKYKSTPDYAVLIRLTDNNNGFNGNFVYIDKHAYEFLAKSKLFGGEIIISNVGANVGTVFRCPFLDTNMSLAPNAIMLKTQGNDNFYYYWFLSRNGQHSLKSIVTGSAQPKFNKTNFRDLLVPVPPRAVQNKIADYLSNIDKKIELNKQINENLLQQARALFRKWFSITSSGLYKLSDIADINPETYSPKENWSFVNYLDTSNITSGTINEVQYIIPSEGKLPSRARRILRKDDVVFSTVRPNQLHYGIISNPKPNMLGSTGFAVIRSKYETMPNEIIYLALTESAFVEQMQQLAEQSVSTFPSIRPADLDACVLPEPKEDDNNFMETIKSIFNAVAINNEENQRLATLRDTLLPRLMSGELDVSSLDF